MSARDKIVRLWRAKQKGFPDTLPDDPGGFGLRVLSTINLGSQGIVSVYDVITPEGLELPFKYQYHSTKDRKCGFVVDAAGMKQILSWREVQARWPQIKEGAK